MLRVTTRSLSLSHTNIKPPTDHLIDKITDYVHDKEITSQLAIDTARWCLLDTIGCGLASLKFKQARDLIKPMFHQEQEVPTGARIPGTPWRMDPINASFTWGSMIRWLDFNDCWLAAEWGHPSDNLGGIIPVADYINRTTTHSHKQITINDILTLMIKAHEIQGIIALDNSFNSQGLDHVILVKLATASVISKLIGLDKGQTRQVIEHSLVDGHPLRTYRHSPNTGSRKSWAAGDAVSRAVKLAFLVKQTSGGLGDIPSILTTKKWGVYDVLNNGQPFVFHQRDNFDSYVMENILFKISFPAEFHAQTAVEAAIMANKKLKSLNKSIDDIKQINIRTQQAAMDIINKEGPLYNYADRDHCIQYMIAVPLIWGELTASHYMDEFALQNSKQIDNLRSKMVINVDKQFTMDYYDPGKRSISNSLQIVLNDNNKLDDIIVNYPIGHKFRREEGIPLLLDKFKFNLNQHFNKNDDKDHQDRINQILNISNSEKFGDMPVHEYIDLYCD